MPQPWEMDWGAKPSSGPIMGPPPKIDPYRDNEEARKRAADIRAQEDQARQESKFQMEEARDSRAERKDSAGTVDEKKVATLTTRMAGAFNDINSVTKNDPDAQEPGFFETMRGGLDPGGFTGIPVRWGAGENRRIVHDAQRDALDAMLTLGTGAAYNKEQLDGAMVSHFPQYNDTPRDIAYKNQRMQRLIASAKANAGPAWAQIEPQIAPFMQSFNAQDDAAGGGVSAGAGGTGGGTTPPPGGGKPPYIPPNGEGDTVQDSEWWDRDEWLKNRYNITPEQETQIVGFWNQARGNQELTPEAVRGWYEQNGLPQPSQQEVESGIAQARNGNVEFGYYPDKDARDARKAELEKMNAGYGQITGNATEDGQFNASGAYGQRLQSGVLAGLDDEVSGIGGAIAAPFIGKDIGQGYTDARDAGLLRQEQMSESQGVTGHIVEFGGSMVPAVMMPGARAGTVVGSAKAGASYGGLAGFGEGRGTSDSLQKAATGAAVGGTTGALVQGGLNKFAARPPKNIPYAREVMAAGKEFNVPVMTSDVRPPKTAVGRTTRTVGENIPLAGTGGLRAKQDEARQNAVTKFIDEFGTRDTDGAVSAVTKDLADKRSADITRYTSAKDSVIDAIPGAVEAPRTIAAIDKAVAKLRDINEDAFAPVIGKLENFKKTFSSGKTLRQVEGNRRLLGDLFSDPSLASVKGDGQKAINGIYGPLREDMGAFIKAGAGAGGFNKWSMANKRLSEMMDELDDSAFKRVLNKAEITPESAGKMLFSKTPSELQRLFGGLSDAGKAKARAAMIFKAADGATVDDVVSPTKFANALQALDKATGVFFPPVEKARLDGFARLLKATKHAVEANAMPMTGASNRVMIGGIGAGQMLGGATLPVSFSAGLLARIYESKAARNLLTALGKSAPGSVAEANLASRLVSTITTSTTPMNPANDIAGRLGSMQSTTAAAARENEQDRRR